MAGKGNSKIRVLMDSASHKSFVTSQIVDLFGLETPTREWLTCKHVRSKGNRVQLAGSCLFNSGPSGKGGLGITPRSLCCP